MLNKKNCVRMLCGFVGGARERAKRQSKKKLAALRGRY
jgi:hypothetical protein